MESVSDSTSRARGEGRMTDRERGEECGVFGLFAPGKDVARLSFFALNALQHRGQESAGIMTGDGFRTYIEKGMGLVNQVFTEQNLKPLKGHFGIGHTRYSTTGGSMLTNAQPFVIETSHGVIGVAHNGNITTSKTLRRRLLDRGVGLISTTDSEVITQWLASPAPGVDESKGPNWEARISNFMSEAEGAFSLVVMTNRALFCVRDIHGMRPLCIGFVDGEDGIRGYACASESCALASIGADYVREVKPGEIVRIDQSGFHSTMGREPAPKKSLCVFEYVYFARPDSILDGEDEGNGNLIHRVRQALGEILAREAPPPESADCVMCVPDSATPAAISYAGACNLPYIEGLFKNRYVGRTFIQPDEYMRNLGVAMKFNPMASNLKDKNVVLVDDSIVRGTTSKRIIKMLKKAGAKQIHVRISSPPVRNQCYMGIDIGTKEELVANQLSIDEIAARIGADSIAYLSHDGLIEAANLGSKRSGHCSACFSGEYPLPIDW